MWRKLFGLGSRANSGRDPEAARLGIDPEMRYCPECGDEYREDIASCATCRVALISGVEKLARAREKNREFTARPMTIGPDEPRVAIRSGKLMELKGAQLLLMQSRIASRITGDGGDCRKG